METLEALITALRQELEQYGELLALLDQQQDLVMARAAEGLFQSISAIQEQALTLESARHQREERRRQVALALGQTEDASFAQLLPLLPDAYRPLVAALVGENNELLVRLQLRARQNHLLLRRSLELMQSFVAALYPARDTLTYDEEGRRLPSAAAPLPVFEAVG